MNALRLAFAELQWRAVRVRRGHCPLCGGRLFVRISTDLLGTRCLRCRASPISTAIGRVLLDRVPDLGSRRVLELSSRGPFFEFLVRRVQQLTFCEYFDDVAPGDHRDGVQCQDVQRLSYPGASFDLVTCTEVFEHVPDDRRGFAEVRRVLAPGGLFVFTVPLHDAAVTRERARLQNGELHHIEPPVHHNDRIRGAGRVLVYRDYGSDVSTRLEEAGFGSAEIVAVPDAANGETTANVIVARRS